MQGCVQVYTGDGKGKTTAALGLALRAAGAGLRVFFAQFLKTADTSEAAALRRLADNVTHRTFGRPGFFTPEHPPQDEDLRLAREGLDAARAALLSGNFDVVVLDEACVAAHLGLLTEDDLLDLMTQRPEEVELVLTGRGAQHRILERADLVTEMLAIRHYMERGMPGRKGIEF